MNNPVNMTDPDGKCGICIDAEELGKAIYATAAEYLVDYVLPYGQPDNSTTADKPDLARATAAGAVVTTAYKVGTVDELRAGSVKGDKIDIHHAPQSKSAGQVIPNYDPAKAPGIALPQREHQNVPTQKGSYTGTPRDLVAKDVRDLRNHTNAPNSALQKLVKLVKDTFPDAMKKLF